jgi:cell division protein FtsB
MSLNRRRHANTVPIAKFAAFIIAGTVVCVSGLAYVWCKNDLYKTGTEIKKHETELGQLRARNETVRSSISLLKSTAPLQKRYELGLIKLFPISPETVVVLGDPSRNAGQRQVRAVSNERSRE